MEALKFQFLYPNVLTFLHSYYQVNPVIPSKNKTIGNLSSLITCVPVFLSSCPSLCRFGTCLISVSYRFVSISIGIFPYVFVPQTSFLNQKQRKVSFPDFLKSANCHLPGVQPARGRKTECSGSPRSGLKNRKIIKIRSKKLHFPILSDILNYLFQRKIGKMLQEVG
jgi:hypothetical protein